MDMFINQSEQGSQLRQFLKTMNCSNDGFYY